MQVRPGGQVRFCYTSAHIRLAALRRDKSDFGETSRRDSPSSLSLRRDRGKSSALFPNLSINFVPQTKRIGNYRNPRRSLGKQKTA
jgi:hypothetical protein